MSSATEPVFDQAAPGLGLYWLRGGDRRAGFHTSGSIAFASAITLTQSWADAHGAWFWLDVPPAGDAVFAATLAALLAALPGAGGPRALWIAGAAGDRAGFRTTLVGMTRRNDVTTVTIGDVIDMGGVLTAIGAGNVVAPAAIGDAGWGLALAGHPGLTFATAEGRLTAQDGRSAFAYTPGQVGCIVWTMALSAPSGTGPTDLERLGVSVRFFAPEARGGGDDVHVLRTAPLRQTTACTVYAAVDPLAPLDPARTRLSLVPFQGASAEPPAPFDTAYVTATGHGVTLTPRTATASPPGFVLAVQPLATGPRDAAAADVPVVYYLTVDGDFDLTVSGTIARVLCGVAGSESVAILSPTVMSFRAGRPAYAPLAPGIRAAARDVAGPHAPGEDEAAPPALTDLGTTAWCWFTAATPPLYCSQPVYDGPTNAGGFVFYQGLPGAVLESEDAAPAFPMASLAGLDDAEKALAIALEMRAIAPERHRQLGLLLGSGPPAAPAALAATRTTTANAIVISAMGLAIRGYQSDPWEWVAIGNTGVSRTGVPDLRFTEVKDAFRQALSSSDLFMVLGSADAVMASGSVPYQLTRRSLGLIKALPPPPGPGVRPSTWTAVDAAVRQKNYPVYTTETDFDDMLTSAAPDITASEVLVFQRYGGLLSPVLGDWQLRMSPRNWAGQGGPGRRPARLIFKHLTGRSLRALVEDTPAWTWPEASSADGKASTARDAILAMIAEAADAAAKARARGASSPYDHFLQVVDDPGWTGVLALSVEAPLDGLPAPLQPLAAGLDPTRFRAHHLGFSATSFTLTKDGALRSDVTPTFGLIAYANPIDQYFSSTTTFAFRVMALTAGFRNGALASFSCTAELMVNRLFGAPTHLYPTDRGNNLVLDGVHQRQRTSSGTRDTYVFSMRDAGVFQLLQGQLADVRIARGELVTVQAARPADGDCTLTAAFQMAGKLRFAEPERFDPFCWGPPATPAAAAPAAALAGTHGLAFTNYAVTMRFSLADPSTVTFAVSDQNLGLDAANSPPRPQSLYARFPLRLTGLLATPDPVVTGAAPSTFDPAAAGYVSVSAPLQQGRLTQPWYGLVYEVDAGTLGALARSAPIKVGLLVAWSPGGGDKGPPAVYVGASLPGVARAAGAGLSLQGILDIGFRALDLPSPYTDAQGRRQYLARLRDFGLHVLGMSFPPGNNDITLFGSATSNTKLGWYAAYERGSARTGGAGASPASGREIRAARRGGRRAS